MTGGLLGRLPDEATELIKLLESAMHVRERGAEEIEDVDVRRVGFVVSTRVAGKAGVPPELYAVAQNGALGAELPLRPGSTATVSFAASPTKFGFRSNATVTPAG